MRYLKNVFYRLRQYMSIQNNQPVIPEVLKTRLWTAASMIACVMAVGIFMEYQLGDGFLKLSCLCSICLGIRFFDLLLIIYDRKYEVVEGEVVRIRICGIQKKHWEITVRNQKKKLFLFPSRVIYGKGGITGYTLKKRRFWG